MAHVVHRPMLVMVCRSDTGEIVAKWVEFREYRNDWEYWLNEYAGTYNLSWPGTYVAFVSSSSELFDQTRIYSFYDPWF